MYKRVTVIAVIAILILIAAGVASATNYMYEKSSLKGTGFKSAEKIMSTQVGFNGSKLVEKDSGSGNIITDKTELEAEKQIGSGCGGSSNIWLRFWHDPENKGEPSWPELIDSGKGDFGPWSPWIYWYDFDPFFLSFSTANGQPALALWITLTTQSRRSMNTRP